MINSKLIELSKALEDIKIDILDLRESENIKDNKDSLEGLYSDFEKIGQELVKIRLKMADYLVKRTQSITKETLVEFVVSGICDMKLRLTSDNKLILLEGSILCKSNKRDIKEIIPQEVADKRERLIVTGDIIESYITHYRATKILVTHDVDVTDIIKNIKEFALGRNLRTFDINYNIKEVGTNKNLDALFTQYSELN